MTIIIYVRVTPIVELRKKNLRKRKMGLPITVNTRFCSYEVRTNKKESFANKLTMLIIKRV